MTVRIRKNSGTEYAFQFDMVVERDFRHFKNLYNF